MKSCVSVVSDSLTMIWETPDSSVIRDVSVGAEHMPFEMPIDLQVTVLCGRFGDFVVGLITILSVLHDSIPSGIIALSLCFRTLTGGYFAG